MSNPILPRLTGSPIGSPQDAGATARAVRDMFAAVAARYDFLNHLLSLGRDVAWRKALAMALREVLARPSSLALDVCCGTGDLTLALARISAGQLMGTDFCRPMLEGARNKADRASRRLAFVEADTLALPLRDKSVDAVAVAFGFRNLADYAAGLREMQRVLRTGGRLAILEFSQVCWPLLGSVFRIYFRRILPRVGAWISGVDGAYQYLVDSVTCFPDQESLAAAIREAGFADVHYRNLTGGIVALHLGRKA